MTKGITKEDTNNYLPATMSDLNLNDMAQELEGLGSISLDQIKIPSGGAITFELPTDNPEEPEIAKELIGVIVYKHNCNTYWANPYTGENAVPNCYSCNGKTGVNTATGEVKDCATCSLNQFNTKGVGKACKNSIKLYVMRPNDVMPVELNVPPSSLKNFKEYITKRIVLRGKRLAGVVTKFTLKKAQSSTGIIYSQLVFTKGDDLTPEQMQCMQPIAALCKTISEIMPTPVINEYATSEEQDLDAAPAVQAKTQADQIKDTPIEFIEVDPLDNM